MVKVKKLRVKINQILTYSKIKDIEGKYLLIADVIPLSHKLNELKIIKKRYTKKDSFRLPTLTFLLATSNDKKELKKVIDKYEGVELVRVKSN
jgi:hypothetical protein